LKRKLGIMAKVQDEMGHGQLLVRVAEDLLKPYGKTRENLINDLLTGDLKFHNVFHMATKTWADAGVIAWLLMERRSLRKRICLMRHMDHINGHFSAFVQRKFSMPNTERHLLWRSLRGQTNN